MTNNEIIKKLDKVSQTLNGIGGRLIVASMKDSVIREAHSMTLELGAEIDDLINELMEDEE
jgi:hypothetical protein